jgi:hypothetical protein
MMEVECVLMEGVGAATIFAAKLTFRPLKNIFYKSLYSNGSQPVYRELFPDAPRYVQEKSNYIT